ncbi:MAG: hypothetical protein ABSF83_00685 [Nitrososphaerales archaeon]|jgi:hypothetical protein
MTVDDKVRYGMMAVSGATLVVAALGMHIGPLAEAVGGAGF